MSKILRLYLSASLLLFLNVSPASAQAAENNEAYYQARVIEIVEEGQVEVAGFTNPYQKVRLLFLSGPQQGQEIEISHGGVYSIGENQKVTAGDKVILSQVTYEDGSSSFWISDKNRMQPMMVIAFAFLILVIIISGLRGLGSIAGMVLSLLVIIRYIIPQILAGHDPLLTSLIGALFIMFTTMYLAHGYSRQTTIAIISTFITLAVTGVLAYVFVELSQLTGLGSEEAYTLSLGPTQNINLRGLLLGGIIIGALGVLDDVTTTQTAAIYELAEASNKPKFGQLFVRGMNIGREHVSSLVNTLIMAYAGAALPLFIFFVLNPSQQPWWIIVNNEMIAEEVIRSLTGSFGLVLAVPLTTALSAWTVIKYGRKGNNSHAGHLHAHH